MYLVGEDCTIVLIGSWNRSILTPDWIAESVLRLPVGGGGSLEMELMVEPPFMLRMRSPDAVMTVGSGRVQLTANTADEQGMASALELARSLLRALPETPITALGMNFGFRSEALHERIRQPLFEAAAFVGGDGELQARMIVTKRRGDGALVNITVDASTPVPACEVNFHLPLRRGDRAREAETMLGAISAGELLAEATKHAAATLCDGGGAR